MKRLLSWYLEDAVNLMHAYIWCYQVHVPTIAPTVDEFANRLWTRSLADLIYSRDWHSDFDRTIKQAVERAYVDFNQPLVMPPKFRTLTSSNSCGHVYAV